MTRYSQKEFQQEFMCEFTPDHDSKFIFTDSGECLSVLTNEYVKQCDIQRKERKPKPYYRQGERW